MNRQNHLFLLASIGTALMGSALAEDIPATDPPATESKIDFTKQIFPIMEAKCLKCHKKAYINERGRLRKPKSGLRLDGAKFYAMGGSIQEDEGKTNLVPGKSAESTLYTYTTLPEEDDLHMPPKGDPLTNEEKELLKEWIDEGASFGGWKGDESEYVAEEKTES